MKKTIAVLVAMLIAVFSTSTAFAADVNSPTGSPVNHVTYELVKTESTNMTVVTKPDASYRTVLKPKPGYTMDKVQILMAGVDITESVYDPVTGIVYIPVVTGDIEIIAESVKDGESTKPTTPGEEDKTGPTWWTDEYGSTIYATETTPVDGSDDEETSSSSVSGGTDGSNGSGGDSSNNSSTSPVTGDFILLSILLALALAGVSTFAYSKVKKSK